MNNNFNVFEVLNITELEIKHSDVLAYLFNSKESHNFKNSFLREFIYEIETLTNKNLDLNLTDTYSVKREYSIPKGFIDILLVSHKEKTIILIENKIKSKEQKNQLQKYKNYFYKKVKNYKIIFIYLTLNNDKASDEEYISINYITVIKALDRILKSNICSDKVKYFLNDYLNILLKSYKLANVSDLTNFRKIMKIENRGING